jgi:hypothetical protein
LRILGDKIHRPKKIHIENEIEKKHKV